MNKKNKDLPAAADANKPNEDSQYQNQEEFDERGRTELTNDERNEQAMKGEKYKDGQLKHESMIDQEKKKQTEKQDRIDRKLPNLKK